MKMSRMRSPLISGGGILRFWATVATVASMKVLVAPSSSATFFWVRLATNSWVALSA